MAHEHLESSLVSGSSMVVDFALTIGVLLGEDGSDYGVVVTVKNGKNEVVDLLMEADYMIRVFRDLAESAEEMIQGMYGATSG